MVDKISKDNLSSSNLSSSNRCIKTFSRRVGKSMTQTRKNLITGITVDNALQKIKTKIKKFSNIGQIKIDLEIGFGNGEHLAYLASLKKDEKQPDILLGCEPFLNGVGHLLSLCNQHNLDNIIIFPDAVHKIFDMLKSDGLNLLFSNIFIFFPDPWHKKKHNKRRLVNKEFLQLLYGYLALEGKILFASDDENYAKQVLNITQKLTHPENQNSKCVPSKGRLFSVKGESLDDFKRPFYQNFQSKYEQKAAKVNRQCFYIEMVKND